MKELQMLAEIENTVELTVPTILEAGIWRYCLYVTGNILPFMDDTFNRTPIKVNNIIVDSEEFIKLDTLEELRNPEKLAHDRGGWVNGGSVIYVRFPYHNPPYIFYSFQYGTLRGFTNGSPLLKDGVLYKPSVMTSPRITHSADAFKYDRMKFNTASVSIENSNGQFDNADDLFGNEFNLWVGAAPDKDESGQREHLIRRIEEAGGEKVVSTEQDTDEYIVLSNEKKEEPVYKLLAQYYIENITVGIEKAVFKLSDKRERLSSKIPFRQYTNNPDNKDGLYYPDIDDNYLDKDVQEAYGRCFGVPGVCLEGKRVYVDASDTSLDKLDQYRFRFSSRISRIDRIQVKMTAGELPDPDNPGEMTTVDGWITVWDKEKGWKCGIDIPEGSAGNLTDFLREGIITLRWDLAKQGGNRDNRINEVRMDGVFNNPENRNIENNEFVTPRDIIKDIMDKYANVVYDKYHYNLDEFEEQLERLDNYEIGILFDKSISVYEAVEKLQSGSVIGFQFQVHGNRYTARLDDPEFNIRSDSISHLDILNINEVDVDWNASLYGTYTNIEYAYNYSENEYRNYIDKKNRNYIFKKHRVDKEWNAKTLLANRKDAKAKSDILLNDFKEMRPIIRNIKLSGEKWFGLKDGFNELRIYDIIQIDFRIPGDEIEKYPHYLIRLISEAGGGKLVSINEDTDEYVIMCTDEKDAPGKREFVGSLRCQIISITPDIQSGITTIDVRTVQSDN